MDPAATLQQVIDALEARDIIAAREALATLDEWFNSGGYVPDGYYRVLDAYNTFEVHQDPYLHAYR